MSSHNVPSSQRYRFLSRPGGDLGLSHETRARTASRQSRGAAAGESAAMVVAVIPVRNEVEHIAACLHALDRQEAAAVDRVVLLLNNCNDGTQTCVESLRPHLRVPIETVVREFRGERASAGFARSFAVRYAMQSLADQDVLLTTDADGIVPPNWIAANLAAIEEGADAVCGRAVLNQEDAHLIPQHLHEDDARETRLITLLDEIAWLIDPDPFDPWPRHTENSGASLAAPVSTWRRAGGIPATACGEDRAFVARLQQIDARVRHAPDVHVTVSGRTFGRADGGMADTMRRRILQQDEFCDSSIEPVADRYQRLMLRVMVRDAWRTKSANRNTVIAALDLPPKLVRAALSAPFFGQAWSLLERASPVLVSRRVRFVDLEAEIDAAVARLGELIAIRGCDDVQPALVPA